MKKTEDKETSSQYGCEFHKNSDELVTTCGVESGITILESSENAVLNLDGHLPKNNPLLELTNKNDGELLCLLMGEQESGSLNNDQMAAEGIGWWTKRMDEMNREEFQQFYAALRIFRERVYTQVQQRHKIRDSNSTETSTSNRGTNARVKRSHRR
ncbi:hypothetical protein SLE2022_387710 [Rubroshorea leprosula]